MTFIKLIEGVRDASIIIILALLVMMAGDIEKIADAQTCNPVEMNQTEEKL